MKRCLWASYVLLAALAGLLAGCADSDSDNPSASDLRVVLRLSRPSVLTSVRSSAEVMGTAFLMTTGGDFVPCTHLHLSSAAGVYFEFEPGSHQDTTDADGAVDFTCVIDGYSGPGIKRIRAVADGAAAEFDLRADVPDWYVGGVNVALPADTIQLPNAYGQWIGVQVAVADSAGELLAGIPVSYYYSDGPGLWEMDTTSTSGRIWLNYWLGYPGEYWLTAKAGFYETTVYFTVIAADSSDE